MEVKESKYPILTDRITEIQTDRHKHLSSTFATINMIFSDNMICLFLFHFQYLYQEYPFLQKKIHNPKMDKKGIGKININLNITRMTKSIKAKL